jgi:hypothetical protein
VTRESGDDFAAQYESAQARKLAVLRWLVQEVRRAPSFGRLRYDLPDDLDVRSPDIPGMTERQVGEALLELLEEYAVEGQPQYTMGRREPRHISQLFPTIGGIEQVESLEALAAQAAPTLRAFLEPRDVSLPDSNSQVVIAEGLSLTPAEAYFQMHLLEALNFLDFRPLHETGGHATFMDVHATPAGKRWLYESTKR